MKKSIFYLQLLTLISGLLFGKQALAQTGSLYVYVTGLSEHESYFSGYAQPIVGYDFVPNTSITVSFLGAYDHHFDGLEKANQIGLWDRSSQTLLTSATVPAGSSSPLWDGYRWATITPITLTAGVTYTIASWNSGWELIGTYAASSLTVDPRITLGAGYVATLIPGLQMPTRQGGPGYVFIGPGFASAVPEPSSLILLISTAGLVCLVRSRKTACQ